MNYNSPFIKFLETIANMLIVSVLWLVFSLPVLTVVTSSAALYHTTVKIIFGPGKGNGVFKDFYSSYKDNLISGIKLFIILLIAGLFVAEGLWTGYQIWRVSIWGMLYGMLGILFGTAYINILVHIPPVLSRFDAPVSSILRLAAYFAFRKPLRGLLFAVLFVLMIFFIESFPLALLIVPCLYTDLLRAPLEKDLKKFIADNGLEDVIEAEDESEEEDQSPVSAADLDSKLTDKNKKGRK
ncbi:MAG: YesL family protein [Erysipelotrichaceae bacterium]|nr:YesL family protein [Erysipelotrichaceae bacterium]